MTVHGDNSDLVGKIEALAGVRVLVAGDVMLDRFVSGTVERVSPEAPVPVLRVERETTMLGGAGNVLRNLAALGARAQLVAAVGVDPAGAEVQRLAKAAAPESLDLLVSGPRETSVKVRYIAGGQQLLRSDHERTGRLDDATRAEVLARVDAGLPEADVVVLSDYGKGVLSAGAAGEIIARARAAGKPVVVDPKSRDFGIYRGAAVVTPNRRELSEATGQPTMSDEQVVDAARRILDTCGIDTVATTRSQQGMTLVARDGAPVHLPAEAREVFDVSGAGDTVVAVLAAALAGGLGLVDAARLANVAAGIVVGKVGTAVARPDELRRGLHAARLMEAESKVADLDAAADRVAAWRRARLRVGFTNGCFDLLHPGHVSLLKQARAACDRLIVGLNADASVTRLKGEGRPVQDEAARAAVLASLADVDMVVVFGEDTPMRLLEALRPDVLIKGADYTREGVVGADLVESHGGEVLLADLAEGYSTTDTIRRLRR